MRSKTKTLLFLAGLAAIAAFALFFFKPKGGTSPDTVQIGAVLPLTGSAAVWGQNAKMGMDLAAAEINTGGGVKGRLISIVYEDSQSEPRVATSALQKLISTLRVQVIIGDIASSSVLAMAPIAERNKVVLLSPGASNPDISNAGDFIFRNWQSDALEGDVDAQFAFSKLRWKKAACLYVNNGYGAGLAKVFSEKYKAAGGVIVAEESFAQGATDLRAQIANVSASKPDGVFMPGYPPEMAVALKQMKETGVKLPILSVQAFDDPEILARASDAAEGVIFSVPSPPDTNDTVVADFKSRYVKQFGKDPGVCSDTGYDALKIVTWALEQGAQSGNEIREAFVKLNAFPGAAGPTSFDIHGDVVRPFSFKQIQNRKAVLLEGK